jgi:23S rRNA (cytosine1962-C5)-methyltransferase
MNEQNNNSESSLYNRLVKNFKKLTPWAKQHNLEAFRLYDKDIPEYPFSFDLYKNYCVIYEQGKSLEFDSPLRFQHVEDVERSLKLLLNFSSDQLIWKIRLPEKGGSQYKKKALAPLIFNVSEGNLLFEVNLTQYLDTGLFLDHRPLRNYILKTKNFKNVLNLFSYTGSLSVAAAKTGATVTSVDLSSTYLDWSIRNFKLNKLDPSLHHFLKEDCKKALYDLSEIKQLFDLVIFDPPTFSNSKKMPQDFEVSEDHYEFLMKIKKVLTPDGTIIFSTNKRKFKLDDRVLVDFDIKDWTEPSIPQDFRGKIHQCYFLKMKRGQA